MPAFAKTHAVPLPVPAFTRTLGSSLKSRPFVIGGLQPPSAKAAPKSLRPQPYPVVPRPPVPFARLNTFTSSSTSPLGVQSGLSRLGNVDGLARLKQPSLSPVLQKLWRDSVSRLQPYSALLRDICTSSHAEVHSAKIMDSVASTTLARYLQAILHFLDVADSMHVDLLQLTPIQLSDLLIAMRLSRSSDERYMHSTSVIKAIRWGCKHLALTIFQVAFDALISKFATSKIPRELRESLPLPLFTVVHWERKILIQTTNPLLRIILGSFLLRMWGGLRWADLQRVRPYEYVFDGDDLRGSCWKTKTSYRGQPFGALASGFLSMGPLTWMQFFLQELDVIFAEDESPDLDFLVPRINLIGGSLQLAVPLVPMPYTHALFFLREYVGCPWRSSPPTLTASNYTIHGLKTTFLSWASQIPSIPEEWRRLQGHHRAPQAAVRLYSRDDVWGALQLQQRLVEEIRRGFRPKTPIHRGGQHPAPEPAIQLQLFKKSTSPYPWRLKGITKQQTSSLRNRSLAWEFSEALSMCWLIGGMKRKFLQIL